MKFNNEKELVFYKKLSKMVKMKKKNAEQYEKYSTDRYMRIAEMNAYSFIKDYFCMVFSIEQPKQ